jgi:hypothetical protein
MFPLWSHLHHFSACIRKNTRPEQSVGIIMISLSKLKGRQSTLFFSSFYHPRGSTVEGKPAIWISPCTNSSGKNQRPFSMYKARGSDIRQGTLLRSSILLPLYKPRCRAIKGKVPCCVLLPCTNVQTALAQNKEKETRHKCLFNSAPHTDDVL